MATSLSPIRLPGPGSHSDDAATVAQVSDAAARAASCVPIWADGTITQAAIRVTGRGAADAQTVVIRLYGADGTTVVATLATVTVSANSRTVQIPAAFSQAVTAGQQLRAERSAGSGPAPQVDIMALG